MKQKKSLLTIGVVIVIFISLSFNGYAQDSRVEKNQSIISHFGAGVEYAINSEINIFGQYNLKNIAIVGEVRRCTHDKKIYFTPGIKYYLNESIYGIVPLINIRYGKLHYNKKWSSTTYDYDIVYVWDAAMGQMMPEVRSSYSSSSGSSFINSPALSLSGGGEYSYKNFGFSATLGMSYYTKIKGDFKNKNKLFFSIGALYYFEKN